MPKLLATFQAQLTKYQTAFNSVPTNERVTVLVGLGLLATGFMIFTSPSTGAMSVIDSLNASSHSEPAALAYVMGMCGLFMILARRSRFAPWASLPYVAVIASAAQFISQLPTDNSAKTYVGVSIQAALYLAAFVAMLGENK